MLGNGDGTFRAPQALFGPNYGFPLAVNGDFNKDGKSDIAVASTSGEVYIYLSDGSGSLNLTHTYTLSAIQELESGDFNGDGKIDLLASVPSGGAYDLTVLFGNGDGSFGTPVQSSSCQTPVNLSHLSVVADLNDDGKADIVSTYGNVLAICISNGDGSFASPVSYVSGANSNGVVVADSTMTEDSMR